MKHIKLTPKSRGRAGIKAEPICNLIGLQTSYSKDTFYSYRHAISPVLSTAKLAQNPKKRPKAVQSCQALSPDQCLLWKQYIYCLHITRDPRINAGEFSAAKIGTVEALEPIPIPSKRRVIKSSSHV